MSNAELFTLLADAPFERVAELLRRDETISVNEERADTTPLMFAVRKGREDCARLLIDEGAEVNTPNAFGWTPLMEATRSGSPGIVRLLLENGADPAWAAPTGDTALHVAARSIQHEQAGAAECVGLLVGAGASLARLNRANQTPLAVATARGNQAVVVALQARAEGIQEAPAEKPLAAEGDADGAQARPETREEVPARFGLSRPRRRGVG